MKDIDFHWDIEEKIINLEEIKKDGQLSSRLLDEVSELVIGYLKSLLEQNKIDKERYTETMKRLIKLHEKNFEDVSVSNDSSEVMASLLKFKKMVTYIDENGKECVDEKLVKEFKGVSILLGRTLFNIYKENYGKNVFNKEQLQEFVTYINRSGCVNYSTDFMKILLGKADEKDFSEGKIELISPLQPYKADDKINFINFLQQYKDENGISKKGRIDYIVEIQKSDINEELCKKIIDAKIPIEIKIDSAAELSLEEIKEYEERGIDIKKVHVVFCGTQTYRYSCTEEERQKYNFDYDNIVVHLDEGVKAILPYDIDTYKKCRQKIDFYLSKINFEKLKNNPNREKIIAGKIIKMLGMEVSFNWENREIVSAHNMEGALLNGSAKCEGCAEAARNIFECCGISSDIVYGFSFVNGGIDFKGHAWNKVKLDGMWYNLDITQAIDLIRCRS